MRSPDKYELYQRAVQDPAAEIHFIDRLHRGARRLREDFCGTALLCAEWVKSRADRTAVGLDLDRQPLAWGREHNVRPLGRDAGRLRLLERDVRRGAGAKFDVIAALNFSYCDFKERRDMLRWAGNARRELARGGMLLMDIHGGFDTLATMDERTRHGSFTYIWEQRPANPVTGHAVRYIHFRFRDGRKMRRAFTYDWRIWTLPEIRDILAEVGFARVDVYWEGTAMDGSGNGVYRRVERAEEEASWVSYVVAWR